MSKEEFNINEYGEIDGVKGEETLIYYDFTYNSFDIRVLVTQEKEKDSYGERYNNIYCITQHYRQEPLNCLDHQNDIKPKEHYNKKDCEFIAIQFYLWHKYGNPSKDVTYSYTVIEEQ